MAVTIKLRAIHRIVNRLRTCKAAQPSSRLAALSPIYAIRGRA
jgi:hypothetical protein